MKQFELGLQLYSRIYETHSLKYIALLLEVAKHNFDQHILSGKQLFVSKWNKCSGIAESEYSVQARFKFQTAIEILKDLGHYESAFGAESL